MRSTEADRAHLSDAYFLEGRSSRSCRRWPSTPRTRSPSFPTSATPWRCGWSGRGRQAAPCARCCPSRPADRALRATCPRPPGEHRVLPLEALLLMRQDRPAVPRPSRDSRTTAPVQACCATATSKLEEEAEDLVREFETALKRRRRGEVVRLTRSPPARREKLREVVTGELGVSERRQVVEIDGLIGVADLSELDRLGLAPRPPVALRSAPRIPERVQDHDGDMFAAIRQQGHAAAPPLRDLRHGGALRHARPPPTPTWWRSSRRSTAPPPTVAHRGRAVRGGRVRQVRHRPRRAQGPLRRGRQHPPVPQARARGRRTSSTASCEYKTHAKISHRGPARARADAAHLHPLTAPATTIPSRRASTPTSVALHLRSGVLGRDATKVFNYLSGSAPSRRGWRTSPSRRSSLKSRLLELIDAEARARSRPAGPP